jgi:sec-independent protein translocase protein TatA
LNLGPFGTPPLPYRTLGKPRWRIFMGEGLFQPLHILLIIGIALLLFGPSKFADLGKGLGEGIRNFKSSMKEQDEKPKDTPKPPAA